jgi:hypothetical protein
LITTNQKHQPVKTSLQNRSLRAAGFALAIALGLAAASDSVQAATVQITLVGSSWTFTQSSIQANLDVTGDSILDGVSFINNTTQLVLEGDAGIANAQYTPPSNIDPEQKSSYSGNALFRFTDLRINGGFETTGWAQGVGSVSSDDNSLSVTLTRVVFDTASTSAPSFDPNNTYNEWVPAATAVPEPGTFLPAVALVMGALLRRRRGRDRRSGSAAA